MVLIIDGHNLIPHIPGVDLSDPDDEDQLIQILQDYCRLRRKKAEVFFDKAPPGRAGIQQLGSVRAHYVRDEMDADTAIMAYLRKLGKGAKNTQVVSSDRQVLAAARAVHAVVMTAEAFAADLAGLVEDEPEIDPRNRLLTEDEVKSWELFFRRGHLPEDGNNN